MITDRDGVIVWVNDAFTTMNGYVRDEVVGETLRLLHSDGQFDDYCHRLGETIRAGRPWRAEVVERHKDGSHHRVMQTVTPIGEEGGGVRYLVAVHEDLTELRASQARLQALFDHALDGLLLYDDEGRIVDANPAISVLSGYSRAQMASMTLPDVLAEQSIADYEQAWHELRETGAAQGVTTLVRADGKRVEVEFQSVASIVPGVHLSVVRDVTEQRKLEEAERFQSQLLDAVGEAVIATDLGGTVVYWNPAAEQLYGWPTSEVLGRNIGELTIAEPSQAQAAEIMQRVQAGETWTGRYDARRIDGVLVPAWVTDAPYFDADGRLAGVIEVSSDISELEAARTGLAARVRQQTAVAELSRYALHIDDPRAVGVEAAHEIEELLGPSFQAHVRWSAPPGPSRPHDQDVALRVRVAPGSVLEVVSTDGDERLEPDDEEFVRAVGQVISAAARHHDLTSDLAHLTTHDPLTGLPNRAQFTDQLKAARAAATRSGLGYAVLFLGLDSLKDINDSLGHGAGDEVLHLTSDRLRGVLRLADTVARFGGDEFAIFCPGLDTRAGAAELARRVQQALVAPFETTHGPLTVTSSIGIVTGDGASDPVLLLRDADTAMYAAQRAGRNRIEHFDTSLHERAHQRLASTNQLRDALATGQVVVHYQPTIALATGTMVGVEALVRLRTPDGSLMPPEEFIEVAEAAGLIDVLGQRVLETACKDAVPWLAADPGFMVAVNLSPHQFSDPELAATIARTLWTAGFPAANLWLEITESALLAGPHVRPAISALGLLGVNFAIDDFGTGYSSLAHLRDTPLHALKIDRGFVAGLLDSSRDRALVLASLDLARAFSLDTVAEGIETDAQRGELVRLGCRYGQGFLWSRPVAAQRITGMQAASDVSPELVRAPGRE